VDPSLRTAATGMMAQQTRIDVIANNLANVSTPGFKASRAHFEDLLYQSVEGERRIGQDAAETLGEMQVGRGTKLAGILRLHTQGSLEITGRPLDLGIDGEGMLQVRRPDGMMGFTRDGNLTISDQGLLVTASGYPLVPDVRVPEDATSVAVSRTGVVSASLAGRDEPMEIGRLELARFPNPAGLRALGENLYSETVASGAPMLGYPQEEGFGRLVQGSLEASNVQVVQEMVDMIAALRAYEINAKAVQASEDMSDVTSSLVR